ncbi:MAG: hypothetical protein IPJ16_08045 [Bacteroidales bacterium]|nr:hypothetical protein [Bacteroidales bacterium]
MKKTIGTLILSFVFVVSFSQKWKPTLGIEGGMGGGGMTALLKTNNPIIKDNAELRKDFAYSGGAFLQVMRQSFGFEVKVDYTSFGANAESFSTPENINLRYLSVPFVFKLRLSTKEGYSSGSWTDESYSLIGNTLYHSPSQYSAGGAFTTNVFIYAGAQYDILKRATHTYGTTTKAVDDISGSLSETGYSFVVGAEFTMNMLSFDFSYQKGLKPAIPLSDNYVNAFLVKVKFRIL